jgi:cytochrome d ubiquinol oxidase subunit I
MFVGVLIAAAWFVAGISAWYLLKHRHLPEARRGMSIALGVLTVMVPLQSFVGDHVASYVEKYKPAEYAAMAGTWDSHTTGYTLLDIPDQNAATNDWQVTVPWLGSVINKDWSGNTPWPGLKRTPKALRPSMLTTFYGFRAMWFAWFVMLNVAIVAVVLRLVGRLYDSRWFHRLLVGLVPSGIVAIWGGWILAEAGRQPWIVYGKLLTAQAVAPLKPAAVLTSLIVFILIYLALLGTYAWYVARVVRQGPEAGPVGEPAIPSRRGAYTPTLGPRPHEGTA